MSDALDPDRNPKLIRPRNGEDHGWLVTCSSGCRYVVVRDHPPVGTPCPICQAAQNRLEKDSPVVSSIDGSKRIALYEFKNDRDEHLDALGMSDCIGEFDLDAGSDVIEQDQSALGFSITQVEANSSFFDKPQGVGSPGLAGERFKDAAHLVLQDGLSPSPISEMTSSEMLSSIGLASRPWRQGKVVQYLAIAVMLGPALSAMASFGLTVFLIDHAMPAGLIGGVCVAAGVVISILFVLVGQLRFG